MKQVYGVDYGHGVHLAPSYPRPQPNRWDIKADPVLFAAAVAGQRELALPRDQAEDVEVGDIIHLMAATGCCYRMVTRMRWAAQGPIPATVLPGTGRCTGPH